MGGEAGEKGTMMASKLALVLAAKSKSLVYNTTFPASPNMFASPIHTLASVPFCWEEEPGKPKHRHLPHSYKCLELPPRLLLPSEFTKMPLPIPRRKGIWGLWRKKGKDNVGRGSYVFPSCDRGEDRGGIKTAVKITSLSSLSTPISPFWVNIYKGFKQVVQRKSKKM